MAVTDRIIIPEHDLSQGSKAWKAWRAEMAATATLASVILRMYKKRSWGGPQSWEEARSGMDKRFGVNEAMRHGTHCEPFARRLWNDHAQTKHEQACVQGSIEGIAFGASLDGWQIADGRESWLEIKSPFTARKGGAWKMAANDEVPSWYMPQLAMQAMLMPEDSLCVYLTYIPDMFDRYTGERLEHETLIPLQVTRTLLLPYIEQLLYLAPKFARGEPEPSPSEYPFPMAERIES